MDLRQLSDTLYELSQQPQTCGGGTGLRAVFNTIVSKNDSNSKNVTPQGLSAFLEAHGELLIASPWQRRYGAGKTGRVLSESDARALFVPFSEQRGRTPELSFSQFMRMLAAASPSRR
jgi:hypothetical protein